MGVMCVCILISCFLFSISFFALFFFPWHKERYAALALESRTYGRWRAQAHALSQGLRRLIPLGLLKMFTENELGLLVAGPGEIDLDDWQRLERQLVQSRGSPGLSHPCEAVVGLIGRRVTDGAIVGRTRGRCRRQCAYSTYYHSSRCIHSLRRGLFFQELLVQQ